MTKRERELYDRLHGLYSDHRLFIQVALSQLIDVPENHPERISIRNRFSQLVADFVLCRPDLSIVAVIELDDWSHRRPDRQAADARKSKALGDAGVRLIRIPEGAIPAADRLKQIIGEPPLYSPSDGAPLDDRPFIAVDGLRLVDDGADGPVRAKASDHEWQTDKAVWRGVLKVLLSGAVLIGGWYAYVSLMPRVIQSAFQPLAVKPKV